MHSTMLKDFLSPQGFFQIFYFLSSSSIDSIENRRSQRLACFVNRKNTGTDGTSPYSQNLFWINPRYAKKIFNDFNEIVPPHPIGIMLEITGLRHVHSMRNNLLSNYFPILLNQNPFGRISADINSQQIPFGHKILLRSTFFPFGKLSSHPDRLLPLFAYPSRYPNEWPIY
ncbi:MAG: hypothetical protein BWY41_01643 [Candidatus Atribacteria bacterium ADurb.Bin276]|uniref:Uncharacterized protein n=1 Tax=Candidatus Atribacter allofermentans TaxID=1852833 RepID=A0A1V5SLU3_9BACT|nr:MAG: hypothetical protein BWY41_01643 [Candidatus Atribacteria bacterium ADurb.Bin276]